MEETDLNNFKVNYQASWFKKIANESALKTRFLLGGDTNLRKKGQGVKSRRISF